jgi:hypothetical protein
MGERRWANAVRLAMIRSKVTSVLLKSLLIVVFGFLVLIVGAKIM